MTRQRKLRPPSAAFASGAKRPIASEAMREAAIDAAIEEHPASAKEDLASHASLAVLGGADIAPAAPPKASARGAAPVPPFASASLLAKAQAPAAPQRGTPEPPSPAAPAARTKRDGRRPAIARVLASETKRADGGRPIGTAGSSAPSPAPERTTPLPGVVPNAGAAPTAGADMSDPTHAAAAGLPLQDFDAAARTMGQLIEYSGKAAAAYIKPREEGEVAATAGEDVSDTLRTIGRVAESWLGNPARMIQAQTALSTQIFSLWGDTLARFGGTAKESGNAAAPPARKVDRRFAAPEWRETPMFDFLHQAYLATTDWAKTLVDDAEGLDEATRDKAAFYLRQISSALSPSNFLATNPELIKETFKEKGENLVRGMKMLAEDIAAGKGEVKIRQSDPSKFELGVNMAATPGKVVYRNGLMELLQYAPTTGAVLRRPLLIVPPWINKFYVLDLNPEKSFIRWAVSEGLTVFVISWVNPDERHAAKDWDAYMREGIFAALDAIETAIGATDVSTVGYCVGGTLLAATLAYMAAKGDRRVSASTFLTTQVDFKDAGDLKVFADEAQIRVVEKEMKTNGYLPGAKMANAFNMLRPDDLIWSYAVNTYLKGKAPAPFDLLAWNADSTRMTAANHAFYLRNCYLENKLTRGEMMIGGEMLNLARITIPIYDLAAKEDHIAPARSVFNGARAFGGAVRYVMAGSGHIAGVVNPPSRAKYQYWADGRTDGSFEDWVASATETKGTWWLDWIQWIRAQDPATVPARMPGEGGLPALCDAPGDYVRVQS